MIEKSLHQRQNMLDQPDNLTRQNNTSVWPGENSRCCLPGLFSKALDMVSHSLFLDKLARYRLDEWFCEMSRKLANRPHLGVVISGFYSACQNPLGIDVGPHADTLHC